MQIELRKGLALYPGTFNAVVAPEKVLITAINSNADLQRFLFLYLGGNYSRILSGVNRAVKELRCAPWIHCPSASYHAARGSPHGGLY